MTIINHTRTNLCCFSVLWWRWRMWTSLKYDKNYYSSLTHWRTSQTDFYCYLQNIKITHGTCAASAPTFEPPLCWLAFEVLGPEGILYVLVWSPPPYVVCPDDDWISDIITSKRDAKNCKRYFKTKGPTTSKTPFMSRYRMTFCNKGSYLPCENLSIHQTVEQVIQTLKYCRTIDWHRVELKFQTPDDRK